MDTYSRDGSPINRTELAFISRGLSSDVAKELRAAGWTLTKLKQLNSNKLSALKLPQFFIEKIREEKRPTIPFTNLIQVLVANRFTCCVCKDTEKAIVVHHIQEWAVSHDHSVENLSVLCVTHHEKAHSKSTLSLNLTGSAIKEFKKDWENEVGKLNTTAILDASRLRTDAWLYFNHLRLFELAEFCKIRFKSLRYYSTALSAQLISSDGTLIPRPRNLSYMYDDGNGMALYSYIRDIMHAVLGELTVLNISDYLERGLLLPVLKQGDFIFVQGAHTFTTTNQLGTGKNQICTGSRRSNHVEITYSFDRWEATSCSAWTNWLRGRRDTASLLRITNVQQSGQSLRIEGTVIAISFAFDGLKTRDYANLPYRAGVYFLDAEESDELF